MFGVTVGVTVGVIFTVENYHLEELKNAINILDIGDNLQLGAYNANIKNVKPWCKSNVISVLWFFESFIGALIVCEKL
ncbi:hypothetical protein [Saccharicrinis fermentans]|uniref:Uncharacterized protein n=1 Tax=Saccharicrinis fermentans DSM 9555 = JCM 21142 TaxID=869213 RepID=W7YCD4_9BACT|nr:hypothetical protein [Saccharicrinis fermentans]GAF05128.1 hypothetical protein JCM21142_93852 [Saccharicrinis fermentans DSM 9555 = JCM 21142]